MQTRTEGRGGSIGLHPTPTDLRPWLRDSPPPDPEAPRPDPGTPRPDLEAPRPRCSYAEHGARALVRKRCDWDRMSAVEGFRTAPFIHASGGRREKGE